jgi:hypothetical protein
MLWHQVPGQGKNQRPRQLCGWFGPAGSAAHRDAARDGGSHVYRRVAHAGRDQQPQARQPIEQAGGKRGAFPHGDDDVESVERRRNHVLGGEPIVQRRHVDGRIQRRPVGHRQRDALVVVEERAAKSGHSRYTLLSSTRPP